MATPSAFGILSYKPSTVTQSEAVFPASSPGGAFRTYVENTSSIFGGILVANPAASQINATFSLTSLSGATLGSPVTLPIEGKGHLARFITQLFPNLPSTLQGILRVSTSAVLGVVTEGLRFRTNERGDALFSGVPAAPEGGVMDSVMPRIVVGGGWNSQVVVFSPASGAINTGTVQFITEAGGRMYVIDLTVKKRRGQITSQ